MLTMGDVQRFIDWYRTQGFEVIATNLNGEEGPVNWAEIKRRQRQLMLTAGDGADDGEDGASIRGGITLYTDQVDALYEEIGGLADVRYAPTDQSYGQRDFALDDPDGYMLVFGQSVEQGPSGGRRHRGVGGIGVLSV